MAKTQTVKIGLAISAVGMPVSLLMATSTTGGGVASDDVALVADYRHLADFAVCRDLAKCGHPWASPTDAHCTYQGREAALVSPASPYGARTWMPGLDKVSVSPRSMAIRDAPLSSLSAGQSVTKPT